MAHGLVGAIALPALSFSIVALPACPSPQQTPPSPPPSRPNDPPVRPADAPKRPTFAYFTQLGEEVLNQVDVVVEGRIAAVTKLRGTDVVRVTVTTWHLGDHKQGDDEVTLLAPPDDFFAGSQQLLFLEKYETGGRFTVVNRVARSDPDFEAKLGVLTRNVALRKLDDVEDRQRAVRKMLYDDAVALETWTRQHALVELAYEKKHHPTLVTKEDREDLTKLAVRSEDEKWKKALLELLKDWPP
jgi:hypothetical protein